jgi:hypothetical protein
VLRRWQTLLGAREFPTFPAARPVPRIDSWFVSAACLIAEAYRLLRMPHDEAETSVDIRDHSLFGVCRIVRLPKAQ